MRAVLYPGKQDSCEGCPFVTFDATSPGTPCHALVVARTSNTASARARGPGVSFCGDAKVKWTATDKAAVASGLVPYLTR